MVNDKHMKLSCKMQLINRNLILTILQLKQIYMSITALLYLGEEKMEGQLIFGTIQIVRNISSLNPRWIKVILKFLE